MTYTVLELAANSGHGHVCYVTLIGYLHQARK